MPMAVPGDPVENEKVLKRMAAAMAALHPAPTRAPAPMRAPAKKRIRNKVTKNEYERARYASHAVTRAKRRFRGMKGDYARYQWAIKWELAWPRFLEKAMNEN